ncbi:MAG: hypothetical protein FWJ68_14535, partial [Planifilum fulgidum]
MTVKGFWELMFKTIVSILFTRCSYCDLFSPFDPLIAIIRFNPLYRGVLIVTTNVSDYNIMVSG